MAVDCCKNVDIGRESSLPKDVFVEKYLRPGVPVILENVTEHWPSRHWTLDVLCDLVGDNQVSVRHNTNCMQYKLGQRYNIRETTFRKYITDLKANNKTAQNSYLAVQNIRKSLPQLEEHIKIPEYVGKLHAGPFLWIAHQGHYEYCHFDPDDGFLIIISGCKQVRLFGYEIDPMYPNPLGSKGRTVQSTVDCDDPNLEIHPRFKGLTCYHCQLQAGDMLYIPAFWWHQVTSTQTTISINMFWGDAGTNSYLTKIMDGPRWPTFRFWLLNIVQQNVSYPSWPRTLSRIYEALNNFLINQWHEYATDVQLEKLVTEIKRHLNIEQLPNEISSGKHPPPLQIRGLVWRNST